MLSRERYGEIFKNKYLTGDLVLHDSFILYDEFELESIIDSEYALYAQRVKLKSCTGHVRELA